MEERKAILTAEALHKFDLALFKANDKIKTT